MYAAKDVNRIGAISKPAQPIVLMRRDNNKVTMLGRLCNLFTEGAAPKIGAARHMVFPDFCCKSSERIFGASAMSDHRRTCLRSPEVIKRIRFLINMEQRHVRPKGLG